MRIIGESRRIGGKTCRVGDGRGRMLKGIREGRRDFMCRERRIMWEELRGTKEEVYYKYEIS